MAHAHWLRDRRQAERLLTLRKQFYGSERRSQINDYYLSDFIGLIRHITSCGTQDTLRVSSTNIAEAAASPDSLSQPGWGFWAAPAIRWPPVADLLIIVQPICSELRANEHAAKSVYIDCKYISPIHIRVFMRVPRRFNGVRMSAHQCSYFKMIFQYVHPENVHENAFNDGSCSSSWSTS